MKEAILHANAIADQKTVMSWSSSRSWQDAITAPNDVRIFVHENMALKLGPKELSTGLDIVHAAGHQHKRMVFLFLMSSLAG